MSTNYYIKKDNCPLCGSGDSERLHMAKLSYGWKPLFRSYEVFKTVQDYMNYTCEFEDEYGNKISSKLFKELIGEINKRKESKSHVVLKHETTYVDPEGFEFCIEEFC